MRLVFLVAGTSLLTLTTSPVALSDGIEKLLGPLKVIHFPAHELAMMMTIALRFIPTLIEEADKIMKAQMARGADFESGNLLKRAKAMIPLLVPLFVSAFRRAGDLAMAMEARCYHGGEGRTRLRVLSYTQKRPVGAAGHRGHAAGDHSGRDVAEMSALPPIVKHAPAGGHAPRAADRQLRRHRLCGLAVAGQRPERSAGAGGGAFPADRRKDARDRGQPHRRGRACPGPAGAL